jgi:Ca2+-dependent lipid-binding protein
MSFNVTSNFMASNGVKRPQREDFKVLLKGARGLRAADFSFVGKGKSDPFCRAQILGRPHSKVDSPHIKKTLDPDWNYECHFDGVKDSDHLQFEVYDYDMIGSPDLLGKVDLPFARFVDGMDEEVALEETDGNQSTLLLSIEKIPKDAEQEADVRCFVTIKAAHNLRSADWGGRSDPYCTC